MTQLTDPAATRSLRSTKRYCESCFQVSVAVAEMTYVDGLTLYGPIWGCPDCLDQLEATDAAPELTGRILGDPASFGRTWR